MLGFTLPLLLLGGVEGLVAISLLLPLPFCRPGILVCKLTATGVGRTAMTSVAVFLTLLMISPIYDMIILSKYKASPTEGIGSAERRETEANANLSGILTGSCLITMFVVRRLGLALAQIDELTSGTKGILSEAVGQEGVAVKKDE